MTSATSTQSQRINGEIITRSSIPADFIWPEGDPRYAQQATRLLQPGDSSLIFAASQSPHFDTEAFKHQTRTLKKELKIIELLNHRAFQFNSRRRFRECGDWLQRAASAISDNRPLQILVLAFCVIGNPAKRVEAIEITAAEDVTLLHLANFARLVREIHPPGARIHVVSDSNFYTGPLGVTPVEAQYYLFALRKRVAELQTDDALEIHDMVDFLTDNASLFQKRFAHWRSAYLRDPHCDGVSHAEYLRWQTSMRDAIDTRKMDLSYKELMEMYGGTDTNGAHEINRQIQVSLAEYRAIKSAARDIDWERRFFPKAIRATIHTKALPVLGLRLYPEYKLASRLLPYHGVPILEPSDMNSGTRMRIAHEITVIGNPIFRRVVDQEGHTIFYEPASTIAGLRERTESHA